MSQLGTITSELHHIYPPILHLLLLLLIVAYIDISFLPLQYMTFSSDFPGTTTAFSTPDSRDASSEDASAAIEQPEAAAEVAAATTKRKRENRYKNAPPSVLSVSRDLFF